MARGVSDDYLRRIPKAELHCHIAGTLRASTVAELARRAGLPLPRPAETLYQWPDFNGFLEVLRLTGSVLRTPEDFSRAVYEYCEDASRDGNLRHVEFFFNPDYFYPNGIDYPSMVAGMADGAERVKRAFGISVLLICCIDRSINSPSQAVEIVETAIAHRHELVVGIGLDGNESVGPPATFADLFDLLDKHVVLAIGQWLEAAILKGRLGEFVVEEGAHMASVSPRPGLRQPKPRRLG